MILLPNRLEGNPRQSRILGSTPRTQDSGFPVRDSGFFVSGTWIPDSIVNGIPDSKAQDWRFHKQKFPRFRNPDSVTWGEARHANLDTFLTVTTNESKKDGKNKTRIIMAACT